MAKPAQSSYILDDLEQLETKQQRGPFVTISRRYSRDIYELFSLLLKRLNE